MPCSPSIGAMPPHINPSHWTRAPACEPLEKSAGLGCAVTLSVAVRVAPLADALMVTSNGSPLYSRYAELVVTVNDAVDWPAATVICGRRAASSISELASVTRVPPAGAAPVSVTVQVDEPPLPPAITDGLHDNALAVWAETAAGVSAHAITAIATETRDGCAAAFDVIKRLL